MFERIKLFILFILVSIHRGDNFINVLKIIYMGLPVLYTSKVSNKTSLSANKNFYLDTCNLASTHSWYFNNFKINPLYTVVLEHLSKKEGEYYLELITDKEILKDIKSFKKNDIYGNPRKYHYHEIGEISPSTIRYIKVLNDLKEIFGTLDNLKICEIGVGYGGQCLIINSFFKPKSYHLIDIQPALALTKNYLDQHILPATLYYKTLNELKSEKYDLVISNYAFAECIKTVQDVYLDRIIRNSRNGYITFNMENGYTFNEFLTKIKKPSFRPEYPKIFPSPNIITWNNKKM